MKRWMAAVLALVMCILMGGCGSSAELRELEKELAVLEYRVAQLEAGTSEMSELEQAPVSALSKEQEMVCQAVRDHGMSRMEIVAAMDYQCDFDGFLMKTILVKVAVTEIVKQTVGGAEFVLIDLEDGTVLNHTNYGDPDDTYATSHEDARQLLYWAFSCRPPEAEWDSGIWSDMEYRRNWSQEEIDAVNTALAG